MSLAGSSDRFLLVQTVLAFVACQTQVNVKILIGERKTAIFKETIRALNKVSAEAKNRGVLFAQVYLDSKLSKLREADGLFLLETVGEWLAKADKRSLVNYVSSFVGPVLDVLGFVRDELSNNTISLFEDRSRKKILSLCYVVGFDESLDQTVKGKNFAVSLVKALKKAGLRWGILTNGNIWRLYYTKEKAPFETFFQIDLGKVIENGNKPEVALFTHFFSVQSFLLDEQGRCYLDTFRQESEEATREIEKHLQNKMEDILGKICMGFIISEGKKSHTEEEKRTVFNNSIYLLYRLLFILFAEARGFLPVQNPEYYEKSAAKLMETVKENHCKGVENPEERTLWNTLSEVFNWINQGNHALGIPPYNGGLFDNNEKPFLANHAIKNAYLSEALFSLGYREKKDEIIPISYDDLSVRHLGTLYEGILEYQLFIAPERMVRRKQGNVYKFIPEHLAGKVTRQDTVIEKSSVYFSQSSGERKLTGSYYTPEHVVRYIVENSLKQYIDRIDRDLKDQINKMIEAHRVAVDEEEKRKIERFVDSEILSFLRKEVLSIRVLDPAMGSGHFLVNVAYYLANYIVESTCSTDWTNEAINASPLWWRRQVVEKCIFGVDINELATELAKLSLWLTTADNKKPLTFLDHHVKTGNSLIGAKLDNLGALPDNGRIGNHGKFQTTLPYATFKREYVPRFLRLLEEMDFSSEEIADIERKKGKFAEWEKLKKNLEIVANTWLSSFFGYKIEDESYQLLLHEAVQLKEIQADCEVEEIAKEKDKKFFHWWLEFPDVFFSSSENNGNYGFDAVIGNPPYVNMQTLPHLQNWCEIRYPEIYTGQNDLWYYFAAQGLDVLKNGGKLGFITSRYFLESAYASKFRKFILEKSTIDRIVDFNNYQVFGKEVNVLTSVSIIMKGNQASNKIKVIKTKKWNESGAKLVAHVFDNQEKAAYSDENMDVFGISQTALTEENWSLSSSEIAAVKEKIEKDGQLLINICSIGQGMTTGLNEAFVIDAQTAINEKIEQKVLRNYIKTKDLKRFTPLRRNLKIIYIPDKTNENEIGNTLKHLENWRDKLTKRYDFIKGHCEWYSWSSLRNRELFENNLEKIITPLYSTSNKFVYDSGKADQDYCTLTDTYVIALKGRHEISLKYILAILNSSLIEFYFKNTAKLKREGYFEYSGGSLSKIPIKFDGNSADKMENLVDRLIILKRQSNEIAENVSNERQRIEEEVKRLDREIDELVYEIYGITESEKITVEGH